MTNLTYQLCDEEAQSIARELAAHKADLLAMSALLNDGCELTADEEIEFGNTCSRIASAHERIRARLGIRS